MRASKGLRHPRALWCSFAWLAAVVMAVGCNDTSTNVVRAPSAGPVLLSSMPDGSRVFGLVRLSCVLARRDPMSPARLQTRTDSIAFSRGDLDPQGRTAIYRFRRMTAKGALAFAAECEVPYTEQALHRVDQRFGVRAGGGADQFRRAKGA
jgi:hypothetical protein